MTEGVEAMVDGDDDGVALGAVAEAVSIVEDGVDGAAVEGAAVK